MATNDKRINDLKSTYDLVVVGGGVTGAGVFHEAARLGIKTILLEAKDFAWGTSSRTSKMVHGGLRYLSQGRFFLTRAAVKEREKLLKVYPGLVNPLDFVLPIYSDLGPSRLSMNVGLSIYSLMAMDKQHENYSKKQTLEMIPHVRQKNLVSSMGFKDAQVDDARLVLRLINDGCLTGGTAMNYAKVDKILRDSKGNVSAVGVIDTIENKHLEIRTRAVINATGAWAEALHPVLTKRFYIRPQRGSHMAFPKEKFPLDRVISFFHPSDHRPVYAFPWYGCTFLGTTDVDHNEDMDAEPFISAKEADYLIQGLNYVLPGVNISLSDCISSIAGIRPILSKNNINKDASKESREHAVWESKGLVTVAGGKLTTFHILVRDSLKAIKNYLPDSSRTKQAVRIEQPLFNKILDGVPEPICQRLAGRYGQAVYTIIRENGLKDFTPIEPTEALWAEIHHAAKNEKITNLSDLLLRRVRLGLVLPSGGKNLLDEIEQRCSPFLSWDKDRWQKEKQDYLEFWSTYYAPPGKRNSKVKE